MKIGMVTDMVICIKQNRQRDRIPGCECVWETANVPIKNLMAVIKSDLSII